jgi:transposase
VIETRHAAAILKNRINKTDKNDARGIADMMRVAMFKPVHVKTEWSQQVRTLLKARQLLHWQAVSIENHIRGTLRSFGLKVGKLPTREHYDARVRELIEGNDILSAVIEPLLDLRTRMRDEEKKMYRRIVAEAKSDTVCRRLMTMPGIGPIVALTFKSTVDIPERFIESSAVGAHLGLTPRRYQSGETDSTGRISKFGDETARIMLVEAANVLLCKSRKKSWLRTWGLAIRKKKGHRKAVVAIARKMAVVLHQMWLTSSDFRWTREEPVPLPVAA